MNIKARPEVRRCAVCQKRKPATLEYFYKAHTTNCRLSAWCKDCSVRRARHRYQKLIGRSPLTRGKKKCRTCRRSKIVLLFNANRGNSDGRMNQCRSCVQKNSKGRHLKHRFGLSLEDFNQMVVSQDGRCLICNRQFDLTLGPKNNMTPRVDHDHKTSRVRALLCSACNSALGFIGESIDRCLGMISYIKNRC